MFAMKIQMNEEKILREREIDLKKVYTALDKIMTERCLTKGTIEADNTITYYGPNNSKGFGLCGAVIVNLQEVNTWFVPNCKKWLFGNDELQDG